MGISTSRALGNAVQRNRSKRLLRESMRQLIPVLTSGWELVFIARAPLVTAAFQDVQSAVEGLMRRAGLLKPADERAENVR